MECLASVGRRPGINVAMRSNLVLENTSVELLIFTEHYRARDTKAIPSDDCISVLDQTITVRKMPYALLKNQLQFSLRVP